MIALAPNRRECSRERIGSHLRYGKGNIDQRNSRRNTDRSLAFVNLDIWQAGMESKYDYVEKYKHNRK